MQAYVKHFLRRFVARWLIYHLPPSLVAPLLPKHRCGIEPAQLACLVDLIDRMAARPGHAAICEIGIGRAYTSVFILEHLRCTGNPATAVFVDTFKGFTGRAMEYEILHYGKTRREVNRSKNDSPARMAKHWRRLGYDNFTVIVQDCEQVDWQTVGPVAVALLDVDLYLPTKGTLAKLWPHITPGGAILVDDCDADGNWPGARRAATEFIEEHNLTYRQIGNKGLLLQKPE